LKSAAAGLPGTQLTRGWSQVGLKKNKGIKNSAWPGETRSKTRLRPVDFCFFFFTKTTSFWFKNFFDPGNLVKTRDPGLEPGRPLDRVWKLWSNQLLTWRNNEIYCMIFNNKTWSVRQGDVRLELTWEIIGFWLSFSSLFFLLN
jgi:hypothetical protein